MGNKPDKLIVAGDPTHTVEAWAAPVKVGKVHCAFAISENAQDRNTIRRAMHLRKGIIVFITVDFYLTDLYNKIRWYLTVTIGKSFSRGFIR